jgi:ribosomal protein S18 acetylase RimI-like enzyme
MRRLRPARPADGPRLAALGYATQAGDPAEWFPAALARAARGQGAVLVAEVLPRGRPRVVGCAALSLRDGTAEIAELQVAPAWRGRGIGSALVAALEELAARRGAARAEIGVTAGNARARALYERLGYRAAREIRLELAGREEVIVVLEKDLTAA